MLCFGLIGWLIVACGGGEGGIRARTPDQAAVRAPTSAPSQAPSGPVDPASAEHGEHLFTAKGCVGCHTIGGGRLTGPDLKGVAERRSYDWIVAMITNPDSMLRHDPVAKQLLAEYLTPMLSTNTTPEEALLIYEYLRSK